MTRSPFHHSLPGRWCAALLLAHLACFTIIAHAASPEQALTAQIDHYLDEHWKLVGVEPAPQADDATLLRREYLDLIGRIPTVAETRTFLADTSPDKHAQLIHQLTSTAAHARHMATFWRRAWLPQADLARNLGLGGQAEEWLAVQLKSNTPYDQLARQMLTTSGFPEVAGMSEPGTTVAPSVLAIAAEFKPENLAANTSRAFLGINLDCAQCHDHPFAKWSRDQFWQTAAFFARPANPKDKELSLASLELTIPETSRVVRPVFLTGAEAQWPEQFDADTGRQVLAHWIASRENPYFARNAANRLWANYLGSGLIEPLDDLASIDSANHPALLEQIAKAFVEANFDLRFLTRAILNSRAYRLASHGGRGAASDAGFFSEMAIRGLSGEQLYDSLRIAGGLTPDRDVFNPAALSDERRDFVTRFFVERPVAAQRSIPQTLTLMNGSLTRQMTNPESSPLLKATSGSPLFTTSRQIETLFLAALSRYPTAEELQSCSAHVARATGDNQSRALADVLWALLNSHEFNSNH